jgi:hypothetical protein
VFARALDKPSVKRNFLRASFLVDNTSRIVILSGAKNLVSWLGRFFAPAKMTGPSVNHLTAYLSTPNFPYAGANTRLGRTQFAPSTILLWLTTAYFFVIHGFIFYLSLGFMCLARSAKDIPINSTAHPNGVPILTPAPRCRDKHLTGIGVFSQPCRACKPGLLTVQ